MKRFILALVALLFMSHFIQLQFPWWSFALPAALTGAWSGFSPAKNFLLGFIALVILWCAYAYLIDFLNEQILSTRIAALIQVNSNLLPLITGVLGGLLGGLSALTGGLGSKLWS